MTLKQQAAHDARQNFVQPERMYRAFDTIDAMPSEYRACVHELGWEPVTVLMQYGLKPAQIRNAVYACWCAPRSPHQLQGFGQPREERSSPALQHMDTLLARSGSSLSAHQMLSFLKKLGMIVVPESPNTVMVSASMKTVTGHVETVTKYTKHSRRLEAANNAAAARLWPNLFEGQ